MTDILSRKLASYAVFRKLITKQGDMLSVIALFVEATICKYALRVFSGQELSEKVNAEFGFSLPIVVVEKVLNILEVTKEDGTYTVNQDFSFDQSFDKEYMSVEDHNRQVLNALYSYVELEAGKQLSDGQKQKLDKSFSDFLLNNRYEDENSLLISSFILSVEGQKLQSYIDEMREGVILYSGLTFSLSKESSKEWNTSLHVFLDTEVIFHLAGLNGTLFQTISRELLSLINEINESSLKRINKKVILFRKFDYVDREIDKVFNRAISIVEGKERLQPGKSADELLTKGVKNVAEILEKKADLKRLMDEIGIEADDRPEGYYTIDTYSLNIEDEEAIAKYTNNGWPLKKVTDAIQSLNYINVRRKGINHTVFEKSTNILLTENFITKAIARDLREDKAVPLCTDIYYFTNRLWSRLHKGFGTSIAPAVFTAACKARLVISSTLEETVTEEYQKMCERFEAKEITEDQVDSYLYEIKEHYRRPEDVTGNETFDLHLGIKYDRYDEYIAQKLKAEAHSHEVETELDKKTKALDRYLREDAYTRFGVQKELFKKTCKKTICHKVALCYSRFLLILFLVLSFITLSILNAIAPHKPFWLSILISLSPLFIGTVWFLLRWKSFLDSFAIVFRKQARIKLVQDILDKVEHPSYLKIYEEIINKTT